MRRVSVMLAWLVTAVVAQPMAAQETLTYPDLVHRMIDLEYLATLPEKGETSQQWSSYDRASNFDPATGKYVNWGANGDGGQFIGREGDQFVMAEMEGPGCIFRIWSARAQAGHVKIYLDGREQPVLDRPFIEYFTGKTAPLDYPALCYEMKQQDSRGENLYLPIPYQKSCKIVADKGWGAYYHFTYTTFPKGTKVPTFQAKLSAEDADALAKLNDILANKLGTDPAGRRPGQQTAAETFTIYPGETQTLEISGPAAITAIRGRVAIKDREEQMAALRKLVLRITFDDDRLPDVWCPLGDFFGTAPGWNNYKTLVTGMTDEQAYAYWYMPFEKLAVVELISQDDKARDVECEITYAPLRRPFEGLGHFHCKWHRDVWTLPADRFPDWTMLRTEGRGRFCGVMLHVWNPRGGWWGEGDEKFFVDGEKFPSTIGTGSEDYFGYAWCHPGLFQRPFHAQSMTQNNRGHQSVLRWHVADNVPFQQSMEACIEKYYTNEERGTQYACVPCFYLAPQQQDSIQPTPVEHRHGYYVVPPHRGGGFKVIGQPNGVVQTQDMTGFGAGKWKNNNQLWWTHAGPGNKLDLALPVEKGGTYEVVVTLTKAPDYGIVQFAIDGEKAGQPVDLYDPAVVPSGPISLGTHQISQGEHKITVEITGANPKAVEAYMFGLDQIILKTAN